MVIVGAVGVIASWNAVAYYRIWDAGRIEPRSPVPLSLVSAILLGLIWPSIVRPALPISRRASLATVATVSLAVFVGLPLLQMAFFGTTDYRRPADAVVVFGARVKSDGTPSITLANRVTTASEVYREGVTDTIVMTAASNPRGSRRRSSCATSRCSLACRPPRSSSTPTVTTRRRASRTRPASSATSVCTASSRSAGSITCLASSWPTPPPVEVWTVPARTTSIPRTRALIAREIPAFWLSYLRAVFA